MSEITGVKQKKDTKFKKGQSGNPNGRPVGSFSLVGMLREEIQKVPEGQKLSYAEAFLRKMLSKAINEGDHASQKLIMNYLALLQILQQEIQFPLIYPLELSTLSIPMVLIPDPQ